MFVTFWSIKKNSIFILFLFCLKCTVNVVLQPAFQTRNHVNFKENEFTLDKKKTKKKHQRQIGDFAFSFQKSTTCHWCLAYTWEPVYPSHFISPISIFLPTSLSVSHYPSERQWPLPLILPLNLYVCIQESFWGCIFVQGCPINLSATSKAVCTMQGGDHNDFTFTRTEIQPVNTT